MARQLSPVVECARAALRADCRAPAGHELEPRAAEDGLLRPRGDVDSEVVRGGALGSLLADPVLELPVASQPVGQVPSPVDDVQLALTLRLQAGPDRLGRSLVDVAGEQVVERRLAGHARVELLAVSVVEDRADHRHADVVEPFVERVRVMVLVLWQRDLQGVRARCNSNSICNAAIARKFLFQCAHRGSEDVPALAKNIANSAVDLVAQGFVLKSNVVEIHDQKPNRTGTMSNPASVKEAESLVISENQTYLPPPSFCFSDSSF